MTVPVLRPFQRWYCPKCRREAVTHGRPPDGNGFSQFHNCHKLGGLWCPMLPEGVKGKLEAHEREDYIGKEVVRLDDNGRPIMNITTTRENGQDCTVYAPTATADAR